MAKKQRMSIDDVKVNIDELPGWTPEIAEKVANSGTMPPLPKKRKTTAKKTTTRKTTAKKPAAKKTTKKK